MIVAVVLLLFFLLLLLLCFSCPFFSRTYVFWYWFCFYLRGIAMFYCSSFVCGNLKGPLHKECQSPLFSCINGACM